MADFSGIPTVSFRCVSESPELFVAYTIDEPKSPHAMTREELIGRVRQLEASHLSLSHFFISEIMTVD